MKEKTYYAVLAEIEKEKYNKLDVQIIAWGYMRWARERITK